MDRRQNYQHFVLILLGVMYLGTIQAQTPQLEMESTTITDSSGVAVIYADAGSPGNALISYTNNTGLRNAPVTYTRGIMAGYELSWGNYGLWGHFYKPPISDPGQGGLFSYGPNPLSPIRYVSLANDSSAIQIVDGNQQSGYILTSNSNGHASWQSPSLLGLWSLNDTTAYYQNGPVGIGTSMVGDGNMLNVTGGDIYLSDLAAYYHANTTGSANTGLVMSQMGANKAWIYYDHTNGRLNLSNNVIGIPQLSLNTSGYLGINTTTPEQFLDVNGPIQISEDGGSHTMVLLNRDTFVHNNGAQGMGDGGRPFMMASREGQSETGGIYGNGDHVAIWCPGDGAPGADSTAYLYILDEDAFDGDGNPYNGDAIVAFVNIDGLWQASDQNRKEEITRYEPVLNRILRLNAYRYKFKQSAEESKKQKGHESSGFLAQELLNLFPEAVRVDSYGQHFVNYDVMVPILVEALKETRLENEDVKSRLNQLENKLEEQAYMLQQMSEKLQSFR